MDSLKAVGQAIKNSPKAIRKKISGESVRHDVLDEDWYHSQDPVNHGVTFYVKYLGCTGVTKTHGPGSTEDAVKKIIVTAKQRGHKLQKVEMTVSSKLIKMVDVAQKIKLEEIPLYRVSYCTVDPYYDKVFCYIARNGVTKQLECHAFLCSKKAKAEAVTLTVAQAFNIAYEKWQKAKKTAEEQKVNRTANAGGMDSPSAEEPSIGESLTASPERQKHREKREVSPLTSVSLGVADMKIEVTPSSPTQTSSTLIRLSPPSSSSPNLGSPVHGGYQGSFSPTLVPISSGAPTESALMVQSTMTKAKSLDYIAVDDEFDREFQRLAEARSNPNLLDIGPHLQRTPAEGEVHQYMRGETSQSDFTKVKSQDDLLFL